MATIDYKVFKHHLKNDGTYNVKYCLTHKGKQVYHPSTHFVTKKDIRKDFTIRDPDILDDVNADLKIYRKRISGMGLLVSGMVAKDILRHITAPDAKIGDIDFIAFSRSHIEQLYKDGRKGYARTFTPVVNNLVDFFRSESVPITWITSDALRRFESFMKTERTQERPGRDGKTVTITSGPVKRSGTNTAMGRVRVLFNACKAAYNTESRVLITHSPFDFYRVPAQGSVRKRGADLSVADIIRIRDADLQDGSRVALARDMFMLSFYLCGMNAKDIYEAGPVVDGRLGYERSKSRGRRDDNAFMSVRAPEEAARLLETYGRKYLSRRYSTYEGFIAAVDIGIGELKKLLGFAELTFYHARHVFSTLANKEFGYTASDIAVALNHVDHRHEVTTAYIVYDWSLVDRIQRDVLSLLAGDDPV